jgi:type II secretory pathway component PulK
MKRCSHRHGAAVVVALVTLLVVMLIIGTLVQSLMSAHRRTRITENELQAEWLAEAAASRAAVQLAARSNYAGENWQATVKESEASGDIGVAEIRVEEPASRTSRVRVNIAAHYPDHPWRRVTVSRTYLFPVARERSAEKNQVEEIAR